MVHDKVHVDGPLGSGCVERREGLVTGLLNIAVRHGDVLLGNRILGVAQVDLGGRLGKESRRGVVVSGSRRRTNSRLVRLRSDIGGLGLDRSDCRRLGLSSDCLTRHLNDNVLDSATA